MISKKLQCVNTCNDVQITNYDEFSFSLTAKVSGFDVYNSDFPLLLFKTFGLQSTNNIPYVNT